MYTVLFYRCILYISKNKYRTIYSILCTDEQMCVYVETDVLMGGFLFSSVLTVYKCRDTYDPMFCLDPAEKC